MLALLSLLVLSVAAGPHQKRLTTSGPLPSFALDYAPVNYLYSGEAYFPTDLSTFLSHVQPDLNDSPIPSTSLNPSNLNFKTPSSIFLTSKERDINGDLDWQYSNDGIPDANGRSKGQTHIIAVDKSAIVGPGVVDVFYFYFYAFNKGPVVEGIQFDLHVGDWELQMIRFLHGVPQSIFFSQHADGVAYSYASVEKQGIRPVNYVASGSHANYPVVGQQDYGGFGGLVHDTTDNGTVWDPIKNYYGYWYSAQNGFVAVQGTSVSTNYLNFPGQWGDQAPTIGAFGFGARGQYCIVSQCKYTSGPNGPIAGNKALLRKTLCVKSDCPAMTTLPTPASSSEW